MPKFDGHMGVTRKIPPTFFDVMMGIDFWILGACGKKEPKGRDDDVAKSDWEIQMWKNNHPYMLGKGTGVSITPYLYNDD